MNSPKHQQLALEAARKSIVLLKNENGTLPLKKGLGSIAVIGPNADEAEVLSGNYNGTPVAPVTVLAGIRAAAGAGDEGDLRPRRAARHGAPGPARRARVRALDGRTPPIARRDSAGAYYGGHFDGAPVLERVDAAIDFDWADGSPGPRLDDDSFCVRWTGAITAPTTGRYTLGVRCATACRLFAGRQARRPGPLRPRADHDHRAA